MYHHRPFQKGQELMSLSQKREEAACVSDGYYLDNRCSALKNPGMMCRMSNMESTC